MKHTGTLLYFLHRHPGKVVTGISRDTFIFAPNSAPHWAIFDSVLSKDEKRLLKTVAWSNDFTKVVSHSTDACNASEDKTDQTLNICAGMKKSYKKRKKVIQFIHPNSHMCAKIG